MTFWLAVVAVVSAIVAVSLVIAWPHIRRDAWVALAARDRKARR